MRITQPTRRIRFDYKNINKLLLINNIRFDLSEKKIIKDDEPLPLTKSEYEIWKLLARNRGKVFSLELFRTNFGFDSESDITAIRVHVKNIRTKVLKYKDCPIETV